MEVLGVVALEKLVPCRTGFELCFYFKIMQSRRGFKRLGFRVICALLGKGKCVLNG